MNLGDNMVDDEKEKKDGRKLREFSKDKKSDKKKKDDK